MTITLYKIIQKTNGIAKKYFDRDDIDQVITYLKTTLSWIYTERVLLNMNLLDPESVISETELPDITYIQNYLKAYQCYLSLLDLQKEGFAAKSLVMDTIITIYRLLETGELTLETLLSYEGFDNDSLIPLDTALQLEAF